MFDISLWEILVIAVVALLVVGPDEFPALVRGIGRFAANARRFMSSVKTEFDREITKADEIKRLMEKEEELVELHKLVDETRRAVPLHAPIVPPPQTSNANPPATDGEAKTPRAAPVAVSAESGAHPSGEQPVGERKDEPPK